MPLFCVSFFFFAFFKERPQPPPPPRPPFGSPFLSSSRTRPSRECNVFLSVGLSGTSYFSFGDWLSPRPRPLRKKGLCVCGEQQRTHPTAYLTLFFLRKKRRRCTLADQPKSKPIGAKREGGFLEEKRVPKSLGFARAPFVSAMLFCAWACAFASQKTVATPTAPGMSLGAS